MCEKRLSFLLCEHVQTPHHDTYLMAPWVSSCRIPTRFSL